MCLGLRSPRFHEPEDHADVADSLTGNRRRQTGQEIPVAALVRTHAGVQGRARPLTMDQGGIRHRRDVQGEVAEQRHVMISQGVTDGELTDQRITSTTAERDQVADTARITQRPTRLFQKLMFGTGAVLPSSGGLPVETRTAISNVSEKSFVSCSKTRSVNDIRGRLDGDPLRE